MKIEVVRPMVLAVQIEMTQEAWRALLVALKGRGKGRRSPEDVARLDHFRKELRLALDPDVLDDEVVTPLVEVANVG